MSKEHKSTVHITQHQGNWTWTGWIDGAETQQTHRDIWSCVGAAAKSFSNRCFFYFHPWDGMTKAELELFLIRLYLGVKDGDQAMDTVIRLHSQERVWRETAKLLRNAISNAESVAHDRFSFEHGLEP